MDTLSPSPPLIPPLLPITSSSFHSPPIPNLGVSLQFLKSLPVEPHWSTEDVCTHLVLPVTLSNGSKYIDYILNRTTTSNDNRTNHGSRGMQHYGSTADIQKATVFVSHSRRQPLFSALLSTLETYATKRMMMMVSPTNHSSSFTGSTVRIMNRNPVESHDLVKSIPRIFFWIDIFSISQHYITISPHVPPTVAPTNVVSSSTLLTSTATVEDHNIDLEYWRKMFREAIESIGRVILALYPFEKPGWLDRGWCLFEFITATN